MLIGADGGIWKVSIGATGIGVTELVDWMRQLVEDDAAGLGFAPFRLCALPGLQRRVDFGRSASRQSRGQADNEGKKGDETSHDCVMTGQNAGTQERK